MTGDTVALLERLRGGNRRSIGHSDEVAAEAERDPSKLAALVDGLTHVDELVRMRAADAIEKATAAAPERLEPYKAHLLGLAADVRQQELRWHLAQMLPRLRLTSHERARGVTILRNYLDDRSAIVRAFALQALADLAAADPALRREVLTLLRRFAASGTPAVRARCRKLLKAWGAEDCANP